LAKIHNSKKFLPNRKRESDGTFTGRVKNCHSSTDTTGQRPAKNDRESGEPKTKPQARDLRYVRKTYKKRFRAARC